jgi:photosystem II stability/assembly factor-like uncharacterized protein
MLGGVALVAAAAGVGRLARGEHESELLACLTGESPLVAAEADRPGETDAAAGEEAAGEGCGVSVHPESFAELSVASRGLGIRIGADSPSDFADSPKIRSAAAKVRGVPGTRGRWRAVGRGPLHADDPDFPATYGEGFAELAGRISDYAYDAKHKRLYASVASGGVYMSKDTGQHWRSIGNRLPTQTVGSIAYSKAHGGTLIAVTGDNAFGGNTYGGLGVYRSTNNGRRWRHSRGVPAGAMGFKAAVDPKRQNVVYAATGAGLYRSTNAGRSFHNIKLPIGGACQGSTFRKPNCFFANIVTDVVVQSKDKFGHRGGAVLAVIGWRAGDQLNFSGKPQSYANGLYRSKNGRPGSFKRLDVDSNGFAPQSHIGRVEMGVATGPQQDHGYVYALVQDALLFQKGTLEGLDVPSADPLGTGIDPTATPTYLNGVYVSADFGKTWTLMEGRQQFLLPTSGSTLAQLIALGFGPGIQTWYDEWIRPDPTVQTGSGIPTRVVLGMEELYKTRLPIPQSGPSDFQAIGAYEAQGAACLLVIAGPLCSTVEGTTQLTTTHPDQHGGIFIPDGHGGVTLIVGNDGGNYTQHVSSSGDFSQNNWGVGAQKGFHTLLPYGASAAKDGVIYAGLQDNGEVRIDPKTDKQSMAYGGDGIFTQVNPKNSDIVFEETPGAGVAVSTDGGVTWADINPLVDNPSFYAPLVMDPRNPNHVLTGGKQIVETTDGPNVTSPGSSPDTDWATVMNLGKSRRGVKNQVSALGVRGHSVYAGYCGGCDVIRDHVKFFSGIATNVGGKKSPKPETHRGWHKVKARGLPKRYISSIEVDPRNSRTVYVTLGASDLRPYGTPKATGKGSGLSNRGGHVYKSTNGGKSFHDISGNIRKLPALWAVVRKGQLMVATTNGVYASRGRNGGRYALLGKTLPAAPVFQISRVPGHSNQLLAASMGRGVYRYTFPKGR